MKSTYEWMSKYILLFMCIFCLVGCSSKKEIKEKLDFYEDNDELITIDDVDIKVDEVMPYLLQVKMEFEELGGEDVWDHNDFSGGKKAEDVAKLAVLDNLIRTKILVKKSDEMGITITEKEEKDIKTQALKYYNDLEKADIQNYHLTKESIFNSFKEYRLVNKVIIEMTKEYVPKEEELTNKLLENENYAKLKSSNQADILLSLKVIHIFIKTHEKNENDEYVLISPDIEDKAKKEIKDIYKKAVAGEEFASLVKKYSQDESAGDNNGEYILPVRLLDDNFQSLIELEPSEISDIKKSDYGYHIFKVLEKIPPTDEEVQGFEEELKKYESQLKEEYKEQLKNSAFDKIYDEWKNNTIVDLNEELWTRIDIFGNINENPIRDKNIE
ncbi:peptidylprolyl isomerase [Vallitalea sp.]|uniref:peptidylprolyl isomerase n=1 Tax=Vallitalea sp. TaxID=1882829 RepID=UPI0025ECCC09|nr:peptidylprolyl isomerase [Vallitalea sp.]MCT4688062.1 peptidylprolyl isomerase [Vallitalea sp.]